MDDQLDQRSPGRMPGWAIWLPGQLVTAFAVRDAPRGGCGGTDARLRFRRSGREGLVWTDGHAVDWLARREGLAARLSGSG